MIDATTAVNGERCKLISVALPDDGTDVRLLTALRAENAVLRADSIACLSSSLNGEARTKPGKLPQPEMARLVQILVPERDAAELFEFVCRTAITEDADGGIAWQSSAPFCSDYALPEGVPDEDNRALPVER